MANAQFRTQHPWCTGFILVLVTMVGAFSLQAAEQAAFRVVVHPNVPDASLQRQDLSDVFLRKRTTWSDGSVARPITLGNRDVEQSFNESVHGRSSAALKKFWQRQIFTGGGTPPPDRPTDGEVLEYVRSTPGAIGIVSARADLTSAGVRVLDIR